MMYQRPSVVRRQLEESNMPCEDCPDDEDVRQSYNFAPGYHGLVYRADLPDWGAGTKQRRTGKEAKSEQEDAYVNTGQEEALVEDALLQAEAEAHADPKASKIKLEEGNTFVRSEEEEAQVEQALLKAESQTQNAKEVPLVKHEGEEAGVEDALLIAAASSGGTTKYKMQAMKWGLIPFWTKRSPEYGSMMKTINCRDDSLMQNGGMWNTMKQRKRCIVVCQGFYEWLKKNNGKEKIPHYIKRKDGQLMCFAGLWDCVKYEGKMKNPCSEKQLLIRGRL